MQSNKPRARTHFKNQYASFLETGRQVNALHFVYRTRMTWCTNSFFLRFAETELETEKPAKKKPVKAQETLSCSASTSPLSTKTGDLEAATSALRSQDPQKSMFTSCSVFINSFNQMPK